VPRPSGWSLGLAWGSARAALGAGIGAPLSPALASARLLLDELFLAALHGALTLGLRLSLLAMTQFMRASDSTFFFFLRLPALSSSSLFTQLSLSPLWRTSLCTSRHAFGFRAIAHTFTRTGGSRSSTTCRALSMLVAHW